APRPVAELRGASVGDAECAGRRSDARRGDSADEGHESGRDETTGGSRESGAALGDAARRGCGMLWEPSGGAGLADGTDAVVEDAARHREHGSLREDRRRRRRVPQASDAVADADSGAVRQQPERSQWERRRARTSEREYAQSGPDVPIFPPAPGDVEQWRRVLAIAPELAPAIGGQAQAEPAVRRVLKGTSDRVDRLRACGNSVVPLAVAYAFVTLATR